MSPNCVTKILLKSAWNDLFADIFIILFGCVVFKISIVEVCIANSKYHEFFINIRSNLQILVFYWIFLHQLQKINSLRLCLQIVWRKFHWKVLEMIYLLIFLSYFLDAWLSKISLLKFASLIQNIMNFW